jgi:formate--tetrahydrofolate ligase
MANLLRHCENMRDVWHLPCVVAVNRFPTDTEAEIARLLGDIRSRGFAAELSEVHGKGGEGALELGRAVLEMTEKPNDFTFAYDSESSVEEKLDAIVKKVYHGKDVFITPAARKQLADVVRLGFDRLSICMAKTQYSFSDDPLKLGAPEGFTVTVRNVKVSAGAGFIVALTGDIMTMPGLPRVPAAEKIDVDNTGRISGLF